MPRRHVCKRIARAQVVDMFGAALPVAALQFAAIRELVTPGDNGVLFEDAPGLAERLRELLDGFCGDEGDDSDGAVDESLRDSGTSALATLRAGAARWAAVRWQDAWAAHAAPLFEAP
jgi:beta-1,4-mannosyltransferase